MLRILHRSPETGVTEGYTCADVPRLLATAGGLTWVDVYEPNPQQTDIHAQLMPLLRDVFKFHPLAIEDMLVESHSPKVDDWDNHLYVVIHAVKWDTELQDVDTAELDVFVGANYLITSRTEEIPAVDKSWRMTMRDERHSRRGADFLLYEIADLIATDYMPCMDAMDEEIDRIEDQVFDRPTNATLGRIFKLKAAALNLRRVLSPQREVMNRLARDEHPIIDPKDRVYFRDVYDHLVRLVDLNESLRDLVSGALDTYLSVTANRTNDVMKTLTIFTVLFSPIMAVTGFFGMNFFGDSILIHSPLPPAVLFAAVVVLMSVIPAAFLLYIRKRGWW